MKLAWLRMIPVSALAVLGCAASAEAAPMDDLVAAAKGEGQLTIIAVPRDWCGYGPVIDGFKAKYGLKVNELNPDAGSGDEIEAIKANKGNKGAQAPASSTSACPSALPPAQGLLQPYKVATEHDTRQPEGCRRLPVRRLLACLPSRSTRTS
jgi:putative spermidine/putrescine transport system substrate-binding protein